MKFKAIQQTVEQFNAQAAKWLELDNAVKRPAEQLSAAIQPCYGFVNMFGAVDSPIDKLYADITKWTELFD